MSLQHFPRLRLQQFGAESAASAQSGPVGAACQSDIAKVCAGRAHGGEVRACLDANYAKVSAACKTALDATGGGRNPGLGSRR